MSRVQCISVIDEADTFTQADFDADWDRFRTAYPDRQFWLLTPRPAYTNELRVPADYTADPLANGPIVVTRDNGNQVNRTDWFGICQLGNLPVGSVISVAIDTSGSMTLATVQASYNYFLERCAVAGIEIVFDLTFPNERWILPHEKDIPPSANISADPLSYKLGDLPNESTLSWNVFGDVTTATIEPGIGAVAASGSRTVSPTTTTTYTLTAVGPAGTSVREVTIDVAPPDAPSVSFSADPTSYINPGSTTLRWDVTGFQITSISINNDIGELTSASGSIVVSPSVTTDYTISATNAGGTTTRSVTITVYQPPSIDFIADPDEIMGGTSSVLRWNVTGDVDDVSIDQGIGPVLITGTRNVSPAETTTYTLSASGLGGSATASVTIIVALFPELTVTFPGTYDYGVDKEMVVTTRYANISVIITFQLNYLDETTTSVDYILTSNDSASTGAEIEQRYTPEVPWNNFGPSTIDVFVVASGDGGEASASETSEVRIDLNPDFIALPDTSNLIPSTDPIFTPDEETILSDPIEVTDIDIPVEIKADKPIQVRFDNDDPTIESNWKSLREIP
ncbi:hypothetical protein S-PM2d221 [Synechococcus phage S-PM2]|uniref:Hypothetical-Protein / belonging to T4-LIKE GC: 737 n=1 Tax=Synechococcus phage S-PM2 TaxID=238854 RepID=Q5GQB6_BPSYP|nr:virion structural protein [Synechococcus phage S-PM2]CAF34286.1 Hypothetical-Protein / belonging to T4-LIKE GC: 737 [Synechococcus phage S-PM2]CFW42458.1 hypothetical protein S-PM2d221 [Synechococcus phage S-PM2]